MGDPVPATSRTSRIGHHVPTGIPRQQASHVDVHKIYLLFKCQPIYEVLTLNDTPVVGCILCFLDKTC